MMAVLLLLLLVALCCGPGGGSSLRRPMWYHPHPQNWHTARSICQSEHGGDLLTVLSQEELDFMDLSQYYAWIGSVSHGSHSHWGTDKGEHTSSNWPLGGGDKCAYASYQDNSMHFFDCAQCHFFYCTGPITVFVPQSKSWDHARKFCVDVGQQLITFPSLDLRWAGSPVYQTQEFPVWIGLHSNGGSWSWGDEQHSDYRNWASDLGSAPAPDPDICISVGSQSKSMSDRSCSDPFPFLCYKPSLVLLQELLTWEQAVKHCKDLSSSSSFRLLSVDQSHMETIKNVLRFNQTNKVWVGLRFLAGSWFWLDGAPLSVPSLLPCPESTLSCAALVVSTGSEPVIEPCDCSEKLNLLCDTEP